MKKWWLANIFWLALLICGGYQLYSYPFEPDPILSTNAVIAIVLLSALVMIAQFQFAWLMWLRGKKKDERAKKGN